MNRTLELQQPKVVSLAEFRRHLASDDEHPPPPRPAAAARQSPPPTNTEAIGWTNLARGRLVFAA
jgi:hypothetical protein